MRLTQSSEHRTKETPECQSQVDSPTEGSCHRARELLSQGTTKRQKTTRTPKDEGLKWILKGSDLKGVPDNLGISCSALYRSPLESAKVEKASLKALNRHT